jgi:hypothetical protein
MVDQLGKNDITWGQANSTSVPANQKVNKPEELTYLSTYIIINDNNISL